MATIKVISGDTTQIIHGKKGQKLSDLLQTHHHAPSFPCGGRGTCGKCRVKITGAISEPDALESSSLGQSIINTGIRLACRVTVLGDCEVTLTAEGQMNIAHQGIARSFPIDPTFDRYGAAVDIGTTTVTVQIYGKQGLIGSNSAKNPQSTFGADVISRISASMAGNGPALQKLIVDKIQQLLVSLSETHQIPLDEIDMLVTTGNTVMMYLLTGQDPECLSHAPFIADNLFGESVSAESLGFSFNPVAQCYLPRCMASFVGADITTAVLSSGMLESGQTALLVDIGTNGEIALWHGGKLFCCSTAAGPAFEGAGIECGSQGITGAIDAVWLEDEKINYSVIGDVAAKSICGSGLLDAVAALLANGFLCETGSIETYNTKTVDGQQAIAISDLVYLTQEDIRMVQLSKGAICAGIMTVIDQAGLDVSDIEEFYIAGGFGSFLNLKSAVSIGLIPEGLVRSAKVIGNAAVMGAAMILQNKQFKDTTMQFAGAVQHVDLAANPVFIDNYMACMMFEEH